MRTVCQYSSQRRVDKEHFRSYFARAHSTAVHMHPHFAQSAHMYIYRTRQTLTTSSQYNEGHARKTRNDKRSHALLDDTHRSVELIKSTFDRISHEQTRQRSICHPHFVQSAHMCIYRTRQTLTTTSQYKERHATKTRNDKQSHAHMHCLTTLIAA